MTKFEEYFSFEEILRDLIRWRVKGQDVGKILPPRREWCRENAKGRKTLSNDEVRRRAIWRKVIAVREEGRLLGFEWGQALQELVDEVQSSVFSGNVMFQTPKMFKVTKGYENGIEQFREVTKFERLSDRVILNRMRVYVRDVLENVLGDSCYSYRRDSKISHQTAIRRLQEWRSVHASGPMFVAECDIRKFFDNIAHDVVRRRWEDVGFDPRAGKVLEAYLSVFSCSEAERRGLPQGGSLSTVLANLVLAAADEAVRQTDDGQLFYARFCDDVVFIHPDERMCRRAMEAYVAVLKTLELQAHPVEAFTYKPADVSRTNYYTLKSKGPFRWGEPNAGEENYAPWVSFLGSQIRYDGETRIRKESVEKHIRSLGRETAAAMRHLQKREGRSGKGKRQTDSLATWFARFRNRLIAKGVGYVTAKVEDCDMCWAGAFPNVTGCADTQMQMRQLDRVREGLLCKVFNMLPDAIRKQHHRYKGRPFSYFAFLEKARRPTNMAFRRHRHVLSYSEL